MDRHSIDRRRFLKTGGGLAAAAAGGVSFLDAAGQTSVPGTSQRAFPKNFKWGTATAAYQVEGGATEEGRGPSIWDTYSHQPGRTHNGDTGDIATDHFHRYKEDVELMKELGAGTYRFSISWSRVFPQGTGAPNPKGLDFYFRLLDELQKAGIEPYCTLFHWDLPQPLGDRGGWQSRDTVKAFADYCGYVSQKLSSRVAQYMTINEMRSFINNGYRDGHSTPSLKLDVAGVARVTHNVVLAHGMGLQAIRASGNRTTRVGIADVPYTITPVLETEPHLQAARTAMREENASMLTVIMEGRYVDAYLKRLGLAAPKVTPEELKTISSPMDFLGLNVYFPTYVRAADNARGYEVVEPNESYPRMLSKWLLVGPEAIYWTPKLAADIWGVKEIYITENGCSADDQFSSDGRIYDLARVMYLRNYLAQLQRGIADGVPVKGYFLWSLLDNFEWGSGYDTRFGIVHTDYKTLKRTPKLSFEFYKATIARNAIL